MSTVKLVLFFFFWITFVNSQNNPHQAPIYKINLDLPPGERFRDVINEKKADLDALIRIALKEYKLPSYIYPLISLYEKLVYQFHESYAELQGIVKYSGLSFTEVFLANFIFEIFGSCTAVVSVDNQGNIIHGRNLEYPHQTYLSALTVHYKFYKNGQFLYEGDGSVGFLGLMTGQSRKGFGISLNERDKNGPLKTMYEVLVRQTFSVPYYIRKVLEEASDFQTAVKMLSAEEFGAPSYLIVSGVKKNEGLVITRDRRGVYNITQLDVDNDRWFLVQTNYDRDVPDPPKDPRRTVAEERMQNITKDRMTQTRLFEDVLMLEPNRYDWTIVTATLCPRTGNFNTTLWF